MQEISSNKPSALPHTKGALSEERKADALARVELKERQRAEKRKAVLSQLSPVQQIQILEDTVSAQLEGLLSIDFMELFQKCFAMLLVVCVKHPGPLKEAVGLGSRPVDSTLPERLAEVPLWVGERLTGDAAKDEEVLRNVVKDVKNAINSKADADDHLLESDVDEDL